METHQQECIDLCLAHQVLRFGEFTLKSGRISPYFINFGCFNDGASLAILGDCYSAALAAQGLSFDVLFGPAYKGIPLVCATAMAMSAQQEQPVPYAFNRKQAKDHGEGGVLVGAELKGQRVCIVDDLVTAGTAVRQSIELIKQAGAELAGICVAIDRQERGQGELSATAELAAEFSVPVISIINLDAIIDYLAGQAELETHYHAVLSYREQYGA